VQWTVTDCPFLPDWVGTRPAFTITPVDDDTSELHFRHYGLTAELDCIEMCTRSWNHFIPSLREYAETGSGAPFGSDADKAWRRAYSATGTGSPAGSERPVGSPAHPPAP
jgi:hypothetical protein